MTKDKDGNTATGDRMTEGKEFLNTILATAQAEQIRIDTMLRSPMCVSLRRSLESQQKNYASIEREASDIAFSRGWDLRDLEPAARAMTRLTAKISLMHGHTDSQVAAMRIHASTRSMITALQEQHQMDRKDFPLSTLSQRLLDCENASIRQMQGFL